MLMKKNGKQGLFLNIYIHSSKQAMSSIEQHLIGSEEYQTMCIFALLQCKCPKKFAIIAFIWLAPPVIKQETNF